jgi:hypothetical protein
MIKLRKIHSGMPFDYSTTAHYYNDKRIGTKDGLPVLRYVYRGTIKSFPNPCFDDALQRIANAPKIHRIADAPKIPKI